MTFLSALALSLHAVLPQSSPTETYSAELETFRKHLGLHTLVPHGPMEVHWLENEEGLWVRRADQSIRLVETGTGEAVQISEPEAFRLSATPPYSRGRMNDAPPLDDGRTIVAGRDGVLLVGPDHQETLIQETLPEVEWLATGPAWSPDGRRLVVQRVDRRQVHRIPVVDWGALESVDLIPYAKAGDALAESTLVVVDVETKTRVRLEAGSDPEQYLFFVGWRRNGSEVLFLRLNRRANRLELLAADPESGKSRIVVTEENDTFVAGLDFFAFGAPEQITFLEDGERFLWLSERDGWRHVYLYDLEGRLHNQVSEGAFPVLSIAAVDEEQGRVLVSANGEERLYDTNLYAFPLTGGDRTRLTQGRGRHAVSLSPSLRWIVDTWSSPVDPRQSALRDARDGRLVCTLEETETASLEATGWRTPEEFVVKAADGETDLYGVLYTPWNFDPARSYPVVDFIYQGPFLSMVPHMFVAPNPLAMEARALAQLGFVTFIVDGRGTTERSKAFQDAVYGRIGEVEIADHTATLHALAADRPWMDTERVGIYGHSWGGYYALHAMLTAPDVFHVGIASAPGELTESPAINEPYLGLPSDNPEAYERGRNARLADNLQGHLVLIHGTADVNAPFSTTMRMVAALVAAGKPHELVVYPGATHDFRGADRSYQQGVIVRTFCRHLRP